MTEEVTARGLIAPEDTQPLPDHRRRPAGGGRDPRLLPQLPLAALGGRPPGHPLAGSADRRPRSPPCPRSSPTFSCAGPIEILPGPLPTETRQDDHVELPRIALSFDRTSYAQLRRLIDALNALPSAPPPPAGLPVPACQLARSASASRPVDAGRRTHGGLGERRRRAVRAFFLGRTAANTVTGDDGEVVQLSSVSRSTNNRLTASTWLGAAASIRSRPRALTCTTAPLPSSPLRHFSTRPALGHPGHLVGDAALLPARARGRAGTGAAGRLAGPSGPPAPCSPGS